MEFEWDSNKSKVNAAKHGISFEEAQSIWQNIHLDVVDLAHSLTESRSATLGFISGKVYLAVWTKRKNKMRIISVRRARKYEEKIFKEKIQDSKRNG